MSKSLPQTYGKYVLLRRIAMGGMAEIFRAKSLGAEGFEKMIVIKRILPHYTEDENFVRMFIDEARIASKLQHSNIVQIYDFDQEDDRYYIAMEYVEGCDLKEVITRGAKANQPLAPAQVVWIMMEAAKGLHYAHAKEYDGEALNIVHRDVSPHNLMVSFSGEVKLMDFGIAKATQRSTKTIAGTVKGKCAYMSPEQARGKPLDGRSDLFALGIMAWEMLTQKRLFLADSDYETLSNVLKQEVPAPSSLNPDVPEALDAIVLKALEKDRDQRQSSVEAFGRELTKWFYAHVDDLDAAAIKPYIRGLFEADLERLRSEYEEDNHLQGAAAQSAAEPRSMPQVPEPNSTTQSTRAEQPEPAASTLIHAPEASTRMLEDEPPADAPLPDSGPGLPEDEAGDPDAQTAALPVVPSSDPDAQTTAVPAVESGGPDAHTAAISHAAVDAQEAETVHDGVLTRDQLEAYAASLKVDHAEATQALPSVSPVSGKPMAPRGTLTGAIAREDSGIVELPAGGSRVVPIALGAGLAAILLGGLVWFGVAGEPGEASLDPAQTPVQSESVPTAVEKTEAVLEVEVSPASAKLTANGAGFEGVLKSAFIGDEVLVVAEAPGYRPATQHVTLSKPSQKVVITLEPEQKTVTVTLDPGSSTARVLVDGKELGAGAQTYSGLPGAKVVVTVVTNEGTKFLEEVTLNSTQKLVSLDVPESKSVPLNATLRIALSPWRKANITVSKGRVKASGRTWVVDGISVGDEVMVTVKRGGFKEITKRIKVTDVNQDLAITLERIPIAAGFGTLRINASPWAKVWVNGVSKGLTPVVLKNFKSGRHTVKLKKGPQKVTKAAVLRPGGTKSVFHDFSK